MFQLGFDYMQDQATSSAGGACRRPEPSIAKSLAVPEPATACDDTKVALSAVSPPLKRIDPNKNRVHSPTLTHAKKRRATRFGKDGNLAICVEVLLTRFDYMQDQTTSSDPGVPAAGLNPASPRVWRYLSQRPLATIDPIFVFLFF